MSTLLLALAARRVAASLVRHRRLAGPRDRGGHHGRVADPSAALLAMSSAETEWRGHRFYVGSAARSARLPPAANDGAGGAVGEVARDLARLIHPAHAAVGLADAQAGLLRRRRQRAPRARRLALDVARLEVRPEEPDVAAHLATIGARLEVIERQQRRRAVDARLLVGAAQSGCPSACPRGPINGHGPSIADATRFPVSSSDPIVRHAVEAPDLAALTSLLAPDVEFFTRRAEAVSRREIVGFILATVAQVSST